MAKIRVLRLVEYTYDNVEIMERDMARWTINASVPGLTIKSVSLPLEIMREDES